MANVLIIFNERDNNCILHFYGYADFFMGVIMQALSWMHWLYGGCSNNIDFRVLYKNNRQSVEKRQNRDPTVLKDNFFRSGCLSLKLEKKSPHQTCDWQKFQSFFLIINFDIGSFYFCEKKKRKFIFFISENWSAEGALKNMIPNIIFIFFVILFRNVDVGACLGKSISDSHVPAERIVNRQAENEVASR